MTSLPRCQRCNGSLSMTVEYNDAGKVQVIKCVRCGHRVAERTLLPALAARPEKKRPPAREPKPDRAEPEINPEQKERITAMSNKLSDLNKHLFAQLDRLSSKELTGDDLKQEIERTRAISGVAKEIIANGKLALEAQVALGGGGKGGVPGMLQIEESSGA